MPNEVTFKDHEASKGSVLTAQRRLNGFKTQINGISLSQRHKFPLTVPRLQWKIHTSVCQILVLER